jgi:uncharacterized protein YraI
VPVAASAQQAFARGTVNLRAGPAANYPVVATLGPGQPFDVMGCTSGYSWCDVVMPDGLRGWVYAQSVDYAYEQRRVPIASYGAAIGIPLVTFAIGSYWGNNYRDRPFYDDRRYWGGRPPPPREGWQRPPPPRAEWRPNPYQPGRDNNFRPGGDRRDDRARRDDDRGRPQGRPDFQRRPDPARQVERGQRENVRQGFTSDGRQKE